MTFFLRRAALCFAKCLICVITSGHKICLVFFYMDFTYNSPLLSCISLTGNFKLSSINLQPPLGSEQGLLVLLLTCSLSFNDTIKGESSDLLILEVICSL